MIELNGVARRECSRLLEDEAEVAPVLDLLGGACIVQRCVSGSVVSFGGVATDSGLLGYVVSRYARTWPALAGNVAFSETIVPPAGLVEKVEELVGRIGWFGLFELELIETDGGCAAIAVVRGEHFGAGAPGEDGVLQALHGGAGFDAELVDQRTAQRTAGGQRVGAPVTGVQRDHQLGPLPFPQRVGGDVAGQLGGQPLEPTQL